MWTEFSWSGIFLVCWIASNSAQNQKSSSRGRADEMRATLADSMAPGGSGNRVKRCPSEGPAPAAYSAVPKMR
jgi:hypothetical protein